MTDENMIDAGEALRNTATIVTFRTHAWGAKAEDSTAVHTVAAANNSLVEKIGSFKKELLAGADAEYKALVAKIREAKSAHERMTLPYARGQALLPNELIFEYTNTIGNYKGEVKRLREVFKQVYSTQVNKAMQNLAGLADPTKYPPVEALDSAFGIDIEFSPVPSGQGYAHLPPDFERALTKQLDERMGSRIDGALQAGWMKLDEKIRHLHGVMTNPDVKRYASNSITKVKDAVDAITPFVRSLAPEHLPLTTSIYSDICSYDIKKVKHSETQKKEVAEACLKAIGAMAGNGLTLPPASDDDWRPAPVETVEEAQSIAAEAVATTTAAAAEVISAAAEVIKAEPEGVNIILTNDEPKPSDDLPDPAPVTQEPTMDDWVKRMLEEKDNGSGGV